MRNQNEFEVVSKRLILSDKEVFLVIGSCSDVVLLIVCSD